MPPTNGPSDDLSTLERLRQKLYTPGTEDSFPDLSLAHADAPPAEAGWQTTPPSLPKKPGISRAALFLAIAAGFFTLAVLGAAYFLIFGGRSVSTDRVLVSIDAPTAIASGDTVSLLISIKNNNPVPATATMLSVDFPETARSPETPDAPYSHYEDTVGDIAPGATGERTVRVTLFGGENEHITLPVRFEYRVEGSNATYVKEATYEVAITSSPITVRAEAISEASSGQPLTLAVRVRSNAETALENVAVQVQYPFGFTPRRGDSPIIEVGTLAPGEEKTVTVTGTLSGEDADEKVFRFTSGTRKTPDASMLAISYTTTEVAVKLAKPFLSTTLSVNRDTSATPVIEAGTQVQGLLTWVNTITSPILDGEVSVKLSGNALDPNSVSAYGGFYRSADTTIVYSRETDSGLARLAPGATGNGSFTFSSKGPAALAGLKNPTITATISVSGRRFDASNVPQAIQATVTRTIKVATSLTFSGRSLYSSGPFKNTGPWPPVANSETTYTLQLTLSNSVNSVADASVSGTLPSYVRFTGATSPSDGSIVYDPNSRSVTWKAGDVPAGATKTASFQVALLPSVTQHGTSPILMNQQQVTGIDRFTQKPISFMGAEITTQATQDPGFMSGYGEVR